MPGIGFGSFRGFGFFGVLGAWEFRSDLGVWEFRFWVWGTLGFIGGLWVLGVLEAALCSQRLQKPIDPGAFLLLRVLRVHPKH